CVGQGHTDERVKMSHYRSNLPDLEFNLFEVHRIQDRLNRWEGLDEVTVRDILAEVERFAREEWAESFVEADRTPLELNDGEVALTEGLHDGLSAVAEAGWRKFGLNEELGGMEVPPSLFWAVQELFLGGNATATLYAGGALFARIIFEEG